MSSFSLWHWFIVLVMVLFLVAAPLVFVARAALIAAFARRLGANKRPLQQRLAELDALHARGSIDSAEHARERARLLAEL